jgi:EpsI family protein
MTKLAAALLFLALDLYVYQFLASDEVIPPRTALERFPLQVGDWRCPGADEMDEKALRILGATDYLLCSYFEQGSAESVSLYVGYHESQVRRGGGGGETVIHPPEHCLPGAGWSIIDASRRAIDFPGLPASHGLRDDGPTAKRFVIAKGDARQLVYFWYQGQGRVVSANEDVILWRFWDRATAAEARFERFASEVVPLLPPYVPE